MSGLHTAESELGTGRDDRGAEQSAANSQRHGLAGVNRAASKAGNLVEACITNTKSHPCHTGHNGEVATAGAGRILMLQYSRGMDYYTHDCPMIPTPSAGRITMHTQVCSGRSAVVHTDEAEEQLGGAQQHAANPEREEVVRVGVRLAIVSRVNTCLALQYSHSKGCIHTRLKQEKHVLHTAKPKSDWVQPAKPATIMNTTRQILARVNELITTLPSLRPIKQMMTDTACEV